MSEKALGCNQLRVMQHLDDFGYLSTIEKETWPIANWNMPPVIRSLEKRELIYLYSGFTYKLTTKGINYLKDLP